MTTILATTRTFAHRHDELPAFHAAYLVVTILSAALFSLGLFAALIVLHLALDFVKYREVHKFSIPRTVEGMVRESLRDVMLLCIGLTFAVYFHHTMGLAALSGLVRSEVFIMRAIGTVAPRYFILNETLSILIHLRSYFHAIHPQIGKPWSRVEQWQIGILGASVLLIALASSLMGVAHAHVVDIILHELTVWM